jgi:site-specific DNA-methyltransferase (adenine-specific)
MNNVIFGDNLDVLSGLPNSFARLVYIDPPFNTGKVQRRQRIRAYGGITNAERKGFGGRRYAVERIDSPDYNDSFDDFLTFLMPRIEASLRCLTPDGSFFLHLDYREVHYAKVAIDELLGRDRFMNEIIWAYDYGARSRNRWSCKHDTILWYVMNPDNYVYNYEEVDRIPYMAPGLVTPEKAARGKTPTDVWWHTIVPTNGKEKTGYPTQKPLGILNRIIKVHSMPGDTVFDFFAGSGTTGEAAAANRRNFVLIDNNADAVQIMARRLARFAPDCVGFAPIRAPYKVLFA